MNFFLQSFIYMLLLFGFWGRANSSSGFEGNLESLQGRRRFASWLMERIALGDPQLADSSIYVRPTNKRNSELTSSIMGIPRTMIDNGR